MPLNLRRPLLYLITSGQTSARTTQATEEFSNVLQLVQSAVDARIDLVQIREKNLNARALYELSVRAAGLTKSSATKLLVNDRPDIAVAAGADGVHLTTSSLPASVVRQAFGDELLIGVSTHSPEEALVARRGGADFVVFGPVFETPAKEKYGEPQGLEQLERIASKLGPFPVLALGGITIARVSDCIQVGARGIAAIRMLNDPFQLDRIVNEVRASLERRL